MSFPGAREVGVEFNSLSKTYGLAGARIGFCLGNREVVAQLKRLKSNMDYGMFLPIQQAAIAAITGDQSCVERTREAYGPPSQLSLRRLYRHRLAHGAPCGHNVRVGCYSVRV